MKAKELSFMNRELWLESNSKISIDKNVFIGLNKLEKVCLNDIKPLCDTNSLCILKINEKCIKDESIGPTNFTTIKSNKFYIKNYFFDYYFFY